MEGKGPKVRFLSKEELRIHEGLREHKISDEYIEKVKTIAAANNPGIAAAVEKL